MYGSRRPTAQQNKDTGETTLDNVVENHEAPEKETRGRRVLAGDAYVPGEYRIGQDEDGISRRVQEDGEDRL
jgi:hypothetical protein